MRSAAIDTPFPVKISRRTQERFYRPELDAVRFFAFLGVLVTHGPRAPGLPGIVALVGAFGLSMFFLLSAYLITELLLREEDQTGGIAWKLFFTRRALRIWPLYFGTLAIATALSVLPPHPFPAARSGILAMAFFAGNMVPEHSLSHLLYPMWSISIEEQFYLVWPPVLKFGRRKAAWGASLFFAALAAVWIYLFAGKRGYYLWFDTPVELLFFAAGAVIALARHGKPPRAVSGLAAGGLAIAGLGLLTAGALFGGLTSPRAHHTIAGIYTGYGCAVAGCAMLFVSVLGISNVPASLTYLGKISYGLYVFHAAALEFAEYLIGKPQRQGVWYMIGVDMTALVFSVSAAHLSYQYFEKPFLRLKERFAVIKSRPA